MAENKYPGADQAHGASDSVLVDASDNTASSEHEQEREPSSRRELITRTTFATLYGVDMSEPENQWNLDCYDIVPDRARTDPAIGSVEMREHLFRVLVYIAESLIGGPPCHYVNQTIKFRFKRLVEAFYPDREGNRIDIEIVKQLIQETLENGEKEGFDGHR
jgi:hypothetical protein